MSTLDRDDLTPTSYALLGLLAVRPWTTYELAKQMRRSVHWFWPRAERKLYDEPKRLVALDLARSTSVMTGRRAGHVYEITPLGRDALREWLSGPDAAPPQLEMESMLRVFFADAGTPAQLAASIDRVREQARTSLTELATMAEGSSLGDDDFPGRRATNALAMDLYVRVLAAMAAWADDADREVAQWPPHRSGRRLVAAGPVERGNELFAAVAARARRA